MMKVYLTDLDFDWNTSDDGYVPMSKQFEILDNFLSYQFELDLPNDTEYDDVIEELKYEISRMTDLTVSLLDYEIV
jgi:hypothetical protein